VPDDMPEILFGPLFVEIPVNHLEKAETLRKPMRSSGSIIKLIDEILTLKDRQAAEAAVAWLDFKNFWQHEFTLFIIVLN